MTPLEKTLKRSLRIGGRDYVVALTPGALKITEKGRRLGLELTWADLISGDTALAIALQASVGKLQSRGQPSQPPASNSGSKGTPTHPRSTRRSKPSRRSR